MARLDPPVRGRLLGLIEADAEAGVDDSGEGGGAHGCETASTEAILRRFTRSASHPTYQAMLEVGRAQRTIFVARYLRSRELQREITEGLNVVETFNGANSVIHYGKGGEISSNRKEEQEMTMLCLRILHAALVYLNTLLLQDVLAEDD